MLHWLYCFLYLYSCCLLSFIFYNKSLLHLLLLSEILVIILFFILLVIAGQYNIYLIGIHIICIDFCWIRVSIKFITFNIIINDSIFIKKTLKKTLYELISYV